MPHLHDVRPFDRSVLQGVGVDMDSRGAYIFGLGRPTNLQRRTDSASQYADVRLSMMRGKQYGTNTCSDAAQTSHRATHEPVALCSRLTERSVLISSRCGSVLTTYLNLKQSLHSFLHLSSHPHPFTQHLA